MHIYIYKAKLRIQVRDRGPEERPAVLAPRIHTRKEPTLLRWYRDATKGIPAHEITRFPFAVLELKLALAEGEDQPEWTILTR